VETGSLLTGSKAIKSLKLAVHLHRIQRPRIHGVSLHITICLHAVVLVTGIILHLYIFWYMIVCLFSITVSTSGARTSLQATVIIEAPTDAWFHATTIWNNQAVLLEDLI
jgi:hypothetical protein